MIAVGADAADDGRQMKDDLRLEIGVHPLDVLRRASGRTRALRGTKTVQPRVVERRDDVPAEKPASAGDDDPFRCQASHVRSPLARPARSSEQRRRNWRALQHVAARSPSTSMLVRRKQSSASRRRQHDRLVLVERRVQQHRHAGELPNALISCQ